MSTEDKNLQTSEAQAVKAEGRSIMITMGVVVIIVAVVAIFGFMFMNKPSDIVEGQVEGTTVRVSGKMAGRVADFYVSEGDTVHAGDTLVHIHSSIAEATLAQAEAMKQVAEATDRKVDAGTRQQIIAAAQNMVATAQAAADIAKKTYDRMERLYGQGVISAQKRDEAKAAYDAATAQLGAVRDQLSLAKAGAQKEDKEAASAMVNAAGGSVDMAKAVLEDSYLVAPCDGTVDEIYPEVGELVATGAPIINILKDDYWVTFNVREDLLPQFQMGKTVSVMLPGLGAKDIDVKIYYIRDMGDYAVWRATKVTGQYDSRTFEVKARPVDAAKSQGLRPGMSAIFKL